MTVKIFFLAKNYKLFNNVVTDNEICHKTKNIYSCD